MMPDYVNRYTRFDPVPGESWKPEYQCLFVANACSDNVSALSIDPQTGALTALTGSPFATGAEEGLISSMAL
jgi:hypothetical protein